MNTSISWWSWDWSQTAFSPTPAPWVPQSTYAHVSCMVFAYTQCSSVLNYLSIAYNTYHVSAVQIVILYSLGFNNKSKEFFKRSLCAGVGSTAGQLMGCLAPECAGMGGGDFREAAMNMCPPLLTDRAGGPINSLSPALSAT